MLDYDVLNDAQREAVMCTEGPLLVLAGAGSGKTRVLTYRIAHLIEDMGVAPWEVLAITFTNKAAAEMRERLGGLIGAASRGMWVSTFHSMCVRMLRPDCDRLGFTPGFTIYDDDDSKRLFKEIVAEFDIDPKRFPLPTLRNRISTAKNELILPDEFKEQASDPIGEVAARIYPRLQERLKAANAFDFDDLLLFAYVLLKDHPDVLEAYQKRFRYLLVDEYQDTNHAQYAITNLLAAAHRNIMVVGDDDQSIYSWRGADIRNILEFETDYPEAKVVKLEQNYRSTGNILAAANAVIANNQNRKEKRLFTAGEDGAKVSVYMASDEHDEGRWIAGQIEKSHRQGESYTQDAVFYRTNAQSRVLEDMLIRAGVPYMIVGGTRFFDRAEIRDVMAYLSLVVNPADDIAAKRVINVPRRGIGKSTIEKIERAGWEGDIPFMQAAELMLADDSIRPSTRQAIGEFVQAIKEGASYSGDLRNLVEMIVEKSGLVTALQAEGSDEAQSRIENIEEFFGVVEEYVATHDDDDAEFVAPTVAPTASEEDGAAQEDDAQGGGTSPAAPPVRTLSGNSLADFVEWIRLRTDLDTMGEGGQAVTLMTVHSSKGLEFDNVFVAGMEETLFPHLNAAWDEQGVEEERRLAYVAITRARKRLYLTYSNVRQLFGQVTTNPVSRFVNEIPAELRKTIGVGSAGLSGTGFEKRGSRRGIAGSGAPSKEGRVFGGRGSAGPGSLGLGEAASPQAYRKPAAQATFAKGDIVEHKIFGRGEVVEVDGDTLHIKFAQTGATKKLLKEYAPIVKVN